MTVSTSLLFEAFLLPVLFSVPNVQEIHLVGAVLAEHRNTRDGHEPVRVYRRTRLRGLRVVEAFS